MAKPFEERTRWNEKKDLFKLNDKEFHAGIEASKSVSRAGINTLSVSHYTSFKLQLLHKIVYGLFMTEFESSVDIWVKKCPVWNIIQYGFA